MSEYMQAMPENGIVNGFMLATVLSNNDDKHKGMLKLRLLCEGEQKSALEGVKVLAPYAGAGYGAYLMPEVGEQVVVGFFEGCIDRPFVLGSIYAAGDAMLSESFNKDNDIKRIKTKSGNLIEISDKKDEQSITIKTPKQLSVEMKEKSQVIIVSAGKILVEIDGKNGKISIKGEKEISLESGSAKLSMKSSGAVELKGANIEIKGDSAIKLNSSGTLDIKGQKTSISGSLAEVKADGMLTLKGSLTKIN